MLRPYTRPVLSIAGARVQLTGLLVRGWADPAFRIPLITFLTVRLLSLLIAVVAAQAAPVHNPFAGHPIFNASLRHTQGNGPIYDLVEPWYRWDTGWYMKIAGEGYAPNDGTIVFLPVYPVLMALAGAVVNDMLLGGMLVSSIACLVTLILLYQLVREELRSPIRAQYTLLALVAFPTAFYMLAAYTESTFLAFTIGAWLAARKQRWWLTAVLAAGAALTRMQGLLLVLPIAYLAFVEGEHAEARHPVSRSTRFQRLPKLAAVLAAPLAALSYVGYLQLARLGSVSDAYATYFGWQVRLPWVAVDDLVRRVVSSQASLIDIGQLVAVIVLLALAVASARLLPFVYQLYMWPTLLFMLLAYDPRYPLNGMMRYVLHFFPIFIAAGILMARSTRWRLGWLTIGALMQGILLALFVHWIWIA